MFRHVAHADIPRVWPQIERGMLKTLAKQGRPLPTPFDHTVIERNNGELFLLPGGFIIFQKADDILHIWMLYAPGIFKRLDELLHEIDRFALGIGCDRVQAQSDRAGWWGIDYFNKRTFIFERTLHG